MDFLWGLTGTQKVKSEHFSVAFKGFQPKAETVKIVDKLDFPDDHPFLKHFAFLQSVASDLVQPKQCIPSPSMLHLICCVRSTDYQPIERYKDEQVLLDDLAAAYQKAVKAFYAAGCRYLQMCIRDRCNTRENQGYQSPHRARPEYDTDDRYTARAPRA